MMLLSRAIFALLLQLAASTKYTSFSVCSSSNPSNPQPRATPNCNTPGMLISKISFAIYGNYSYAGREQVCATGAAPVCTAPTAATVFAAACLNKRQVRAVNIPCAHIPVFPF